MIEGKGFWCVCFTKVSEKIYNSFGTEIDKFYQICPKEMLDKLENPISLKKIHGYAS